MLLFFAGTIDVNIRNTKVNNMYEIAICDDMPYVANDLKYILTTHFGDDISVDSFTSGKTLFINATKKKYDVVIMDINLSGGDEIDDDEGMILSRKIKDICPDTMMIFISGLCGYEKKLVQFEPFRFLQKPIMPEELCATVEAAVRRVESREVRLFSFKKAKVTFAVGVNDIHYFASRGRIVHMFCARDSTDFYARLDQVEDEINELSDTFVRVGKSFLVNMVYINYFSTRNGVTLSDGTVIPISRSHKYADSAARKWEEFRNCSFGKKIRD